MTVQDSSKNNGRLHSNSDNISGVNNWNHDAIYPNTSKVRSSYGLMPKTENNVRSLENLHRAFSIAIRSYPQNSSQWLRLNCQLEQVREDLDAISSQDIKVHDPNTTQVDMKPPSKNGLVKDDKPSDGGQVYIRILHPTLSPTNDEILATDGENILAVDGEDVRQLSPEEVDKLQCRITTREVQKMWTVKDENNMLVGYGDGSNRANDQLPLMVRGADWA
mmetsp:Transcript_15740/g.33250  ORF Transcript_15740/g.33250 Transcript_15740/m.33250 type:complete len:220 (+) Transcript_15740:1199-1858(+)